MTDPTHLRQGRLRHPPFIWTAARDDYVAGDSAPQVCERYGLCVSTLRRRAAAEGWRRTDQEQAEPPPVEPAPPPPHIFERDESEVVAELAWRMATGQIYRGRLIAARGWTRLHRDLAAIAASRARAIARGERLIEPPDMSTAPAPGCSDDGEPRNVDADGIEIDPDWDESEWNV